MYDGETIDKKNMKVQAIALLKSCQKLSKP